MGMVASRRCPPGALEARKTRNSGPRSPRRPRGVGPGQRVRGQRELHLRGRRPLRALHGARRATRGDGTPAPAVLDRVGPLLHLRTDAGPGGVRGRPRERERTPGERGRFGADPRRPGADQRFRPTADDDRRGRRRACTSHTCLARRGRERREAWRQRRHTARRAHPIPRRPGLPGRLCGGAGRLPGELPGRLLREVMQRQACALPRAVRGGTRALASGAPFGAEAVTIRDCRDRSCPSTREAVI